VTGAAGGLGRGLVDEFSSLGWSVIGADQCSRPAGIECTEWVEGDLTAEDTRDRLRKLTNGSLDALVNNAAVQLNRSLTETTDADWLRSIEVNLSMAFQLIRDLSDALAARKGGVVNIGSVHTVATSHNVFPYAVSKSAMVGLTRSAALEMAGLGVRCNSVLLGAVDTPMLRDGLSRREHKEGAEGNLRQLVDRTPLGFLARPTDVAPTVRFLADSSLSPYMTGQSVVVDGGATLRLATE
jgi:NAD(P)-dependent dehydrogenase (short-subunit alcohol dehydrogenase family)